MHERPSVTFACVGENTSVWHRRIARLVKSLRTFGSAAADAPISVYVVNSCDDRFRELLSELGAGVEIVSPPIPGLPYANKLEMFSRFDPDSAQRLVALDCDTVVLGDPSQFGADVDLAAKPADSDFLTAGDWKRFFDWLGVEPPPRRFRTSTLGQRTYPYFNSGVVVVRGSLVPALAREWQRWCSAMPEFFALHPSHASISTFADQLALTATILKLGIDVRPLPVHANYPAHLPLHRTTRTTALAPVVYHYHSFVDGRGFLRATADRSTNAKLDFLNQWEASVLSLNYDGLARPGFRDSIRYVLRGQRWYQARSMRSLRARRAQRTVARRRT